MDTTRSGLLLRNPFLHRPATIFLRHRSPDFFTQFFTHSLIRYLSLVFSLSVLPSFDVRYRFIAQFLLALSQIFGHFCLLGHSTRTRGMETWSVMLGIRPLVLMAGFDLSRTGPLLVKEGVGQGRAALYTNGSPLVVGGELEEKPLLLARALAVSPSLTTVSGNGCSYL